MVNGEEDGFVAKESLTMNKAQLPLSLSTQRIFSSWEAQPDIITRCDMKGGMRGNLDQIITNFHREQIL